MSDPRPARPAPPPSRAITAMEAFCVLLIPVLAYLVLKAIP